MIEFDDIDSRLHGISKDRKWAAAKTAYSESAVREALAPNSKKRSKRLQKALSEAIEAEEQLQALRAKKSDQFTGCRIELEVPRWKFNAWDRESRHRKFATLAEWVVATCDAQAEIEMKKVKPKGLPESPIVPPKSETA